MGCTVIAVRNGRIEQVHNETKKSELCWFCCHPYKSEPIPFPLSYDERRDQYKVCGAFCSWACVHAYGRDRSRTHTGSLCRGMDMFRLYRQMTKSKDPPPVAPPRQTLRAFGGHLTIDAFRETSKTYMYASVPENCVVSPSILLKYESIEPARTAANRFLSVTKREDSLRLSTKETEPKPKKAKTLLETALGL